MSMQNAGSMSKAMIYFMLKAEKSSIKTLYDLKIDGKRLFFDFK